MMKVATFSVAVVTTACSPADAVALDAQLDASAQLDAAPAPAPIPITMVKLANGNVVPTVQVAIGDSPPFTALLDTGSVGLRVVTGTVADTAWQVGTQTTMATYGSGLVAGGVVATAIVTVATRATAEPITMEDITSVS